MREAAGPVTRSHLLAPARALRPPAWWISSSALLSWVIWGIIPKVSSTGGSVVRSGAGVWLWFDLSSK